MCKYFGATLEFIAEITAQKMKFYIKDFSSKCDQIRRKLRIWSHLLEKSLMENFILCAMTCSLNVCLMYEDSSLILLPSNLKYINLYFIHNSMKAHSSSLYPSELVLFFKNDPRCFGSFGKFQDALEISL